MPEASGVKPQLPYCKARFTGDRPQVQEPIALPTYNLQPMTQDTKPDYEAIEQQIIELFEQLSPKRKFELLEQLDTVLVDEQYAKAVNRTPTLGRLRADD